MLGKQGWVMWGMDDVLGEENHAYPLISGNPTWIWSTCYKELEENSIKGPLYCGQDVGWGTWEIY